MSTYAGRRVAAQMSRDGIKKLRRWSKPKPGIGATIQKRLDLPFCAHPGCIREAGYSTPHGFRCFMHAREQVPA